MRRVISFFCACAMSFMGILSSDLKLNINRDIKAGFKKFKNYIEIEDRKKAIEYGFGLLCKNDAVLILGKGGETKQLILGKSIKYNEQEVVNNLLNKK